MSQLPKLWILYQALSSEEKKGAKKWIQMRHPSKMSKKRKCWNLLEKGTDPEALTKKLFSQNVDPDGAFRKMVSELGVDLEEYLITQLVLQDPQRKNALLLHVLNERPQCEKWFKASYHKIEEQISSTTSSKDNHHYELQYELQAEYQQHLQKGGDPSVIKIEYALLEILNKRYLYDRYIVELGLTISQRNNPDRESIMGDSLLLLSSKYQSDPGIVFLEQIYRLLFGDASISLTKLCTTFQEELFEWFSLENKKAIFSFLHACLGESLSANTTEERIRALFDWYVWGIKHKLLIYNGILLPGHYKNLFKLAFRLKVFAEVKPYLTSLKELLPEEEREEVSVYQELMFLFESRENLTRVLQLTKLKYKHPHNELNVRIIALKVLFEQQQRQTYRTELISLGRRIEKLGKKLSQRQAQNFLRRWELFDRLYTVDITTEASRKSFLDFLDATPLGPDHSWILQQIDELS